MKIALRALCALAPAFAAQAEFSWELAGLVGQAERSDATDQFQSEFESDLISLSGTYYVDPVEDESGPHALAAFLDPGTHVWAAASETSETNRLFAPGTSNEIEREISDYSLGGLYLLSQSKWYAGGRYSRGDIDGPLPPGTAPAPPIAVVSSTDLEDYGVVAGKYFGTGATRLELSLDRSKTTNESSLTFCLFTCVTVGASAESTADTARLDVMHVRRFRSATYALRGAISETEGEVTARSTAIPGPATVFEAEPFHAYSVGAELYPVPTIGVRLGYTRTDGPVSEDEDISIGASWFFRRNIGLDLRLSREDSEVLPRTERAVLRVIGRL